MSDDELARYARQLILPEVDLEGQARLKQSRVLVIGAGGLGTPQPSILQAPEWGLFALRMMTE